MFLKFKNLAVSHSVERNLSRYR